MNTEKSIYSLFLKILLNYELIALKILLIRILIRINFCNRIWIARNLNLAYHKARKMRKSCSSAAEYFKNAGLVNQGRDTSGIKK